MKRRRLYVVTTVLYSVLLGHFLYANFVNSGNYHLRLDNAAYQTFIKDQKKKEQMIIDQNSADCNGSCEINTALCDDPFAPDVDPNTGECSGPGRPNDLGFPMATNGNYYANYTTTSVIYMNEHFTTSYAINAIYLITISTGYVSVISYHRRSIKAKK